VRHLPLDRDSERATRKREHAKLMTDGRWERHRQERDERRSGINAKAAASVTGLSHDEVLRLGAIMYWCEGTKVKPWRPGTERLVFTNSDPGLIRLYLRFLDALRVSAERIQFRVAIHETADVDAAVRWWADVIEVSAECFLRTTLKRHTAKTLGRHNVGDDYHGCLVVTVRRSRELYWTVEGLVAGLVATAVAGSAYGFASQPDIR
jgi:hypothetical protein